MFHTVGLDISLHRHGNDYGVTALMPVKANNYLQMETNLLRLDFS
jgi:hypothetical protein